jgi:MFS family permease
MIATTLGMAPVRVMSAPRSLLDIKPVFRNRTALGYVLGYGAHCFELYGLRTWVVTFWTYIAARSGGMAVLAPITVSVIVAVLAMPASILGNEAALRFGRQRVIVCNMCLAGITATTIALSLGTSPEILLLLLLLYSITIPADSGALTSGMSASAQPAYRGATMALHSTVGFGLSAAGGWAVGAVLDIGGGMNVPLGWILAFLVMGGGGMLGPAALWWSRRPLASGYVSAKAGMTSQKLAPRPYDCFRWRGVQRAPISSSCRRRPLSLSALPAASSDPSIEHYCGSPLNPRLC